MIPVILIHKGYSSYLNSTIMQSCNYNKTVLISDNNIKLQNENFEFFDLKNLDYNFSNFKQNYVHLNTTPLDYELFCYERWFILKEYMKSKNLDVIFYIDSDVLLFVDVNDEWKKFNQFDFTLLHRSAATSSFITYKGLSNFCDFLEKTYQDKSSYPFKKISSHFFVRRDCRLPGGVCDMTFLEYFHYNSDIGGGPGRVGEMMHIVNDSTYDHNINAADQDFDFINGIKNVIIKDNTPYVYSKKLQKLIKFNALHFQGQSKNLIDKFYLNLNTK